MHLRLVDVAIVVAYLGIIAVISYFVAVRQKNKEDFLLAGRKMHWFPVSLSAVAAAFSAISLIGAPGYVVGHDMRMLPGLFTGIISIPIVFFIVIPFLYKLRLVSVYEFLENRFSITIRYVGSLMFMLTKLGYLAMVIVTPSLALEAVTGIDLWIMVVGFGLLTTIFTIAGGLEGVIWTELVQYFVIVGGVLAVILFFIFGNGGAGLGTYWDLAVEGGKTEMMDLSFSFADLTIWVLIVNSTLMGVANMCNDQANIQRYFSARTIGDAMKGYLFSLIFGVPLVLALYFIGAWLYGFFMQQGGIPEQFKEYPDQLFPYFVANYLPAGVTGLIFAGIFAAGMSTISGVLHSLTSLSMVDFYERFTGSKDRGRHYVVISRCVTMVWGALAILLAFYIMELGKTIVEVTAIAGSFLAGPLGGIYFLGIFTKRANNIGAIVGGITGVVLNVGAYLLNRYEIIALNFMWYAVIGILSTYVVGYLVSLVFPDGKRIAEKSKETEAAVEAAAPSA
jgi:sodium-coupled monocarboxylate transporter 8/12